MATIKRNELINALKAIKPYCAVGKTVLATSKMVLFDGPKCELRATNFRVYATVPLRTVHHATSIVQRDFTGEDVPFIDKPREELEAMKADELRALAEGLTEAQAAEIPGGVSKGKKADLVDALIAAKVPAKTERIDVQVEDRFLVDPCLLEKIVKSMDVAADAEIEISVNEFDFPAHSREGFYPTTLQIGENFQSIKVMSDNEFPEWPEEKTGPDAAMSRILENISGKKLAAVAVVPAESDGDRHHTANVFFDPAGKAVVGTDGSRLHALDAGVFGDKKIFIDAPSMHTVGKMAGDHMVNIDASQDGTRVAISAIIDGAGKDETVDLHLVATNDPEMNYPGYKGIVGTELPAEVKMDSKVILKALKEAGALLDADMKFVVLNMTEETIGASVYNPNTGHYDRANAVKFEEGTLAEPFNIGIMCKFLTQAIGAVGEKMTMRLRNAESPIRITGSGMAGFQAMVMPVRM